MEKFGYIYIMTNKHKTVLYIGVTHHLVRRIYEHKNHLIKGSMTFCVEGIGFVITIGI